MLTPTDKNTVDLYQPGRALTGFQSAMLLVLAFLLVFPVILHGAGNSDAVNERIPVSAKQLEAHWGIDCTAIWGSLDAGDCPPAPELPRTLQLCAAIYQRPGDSGRLACPDYAAASTAAATGDCERLRHILLSARKCRGLGD